MRGRGEREGWREGGKGRERWCTESCHWCENSMDGRQTLEAIFTSSANSDRLPPPAPSRISAALSHERTSLFPHFHPSQTIGCHCSSKYPNNMLFFSKLGCISELSMMGLKMTSNGPVWFSLHRVARNMFGYERSGKRERIQKKKPREWSFSFRWRAPPENFFRVSSFGASCRLFVAQAAPPTPPPQKKKLFAI